MKLGKVNNGYEIEVELNLPVDSQESNYGTLQISQLKAQDESINGTHSRKKRKSKTQEPDSEEADEVNQSCSFIGNVLEKFWAYLSDFLAERKTLVVGLVYVILALLYNAYFIASIYYSIHNNISMNWCNGVGLLIILTVITYVSLFYFQIVKRFWGKSIHQAALKPIGAYYDRVWKYRLVHSSNSFDNRRNSP